MLVAPHEVVRTVAVLRGDNLTAGRAVASHLVNLGHRDDRFCGRACATRSTRSHRLRGLTEELLRRGISLNSKATGHCGSYEAEAGARFAQRLLERKLEVTALVFGNDALAIGFMRVAQQRGIRMPQDLSIVGFDNIPSGAHGVAGPDDRGTADARHGPRRVPLPVRIRSAAAGDERRIPDGADHAGKHGNASAMLNVEC